METAETTQMTLARWLLAGVKAGETTEANDKILALNDDERDEKDWVANPVGLLLIGKFGSAEAADRACRQTGGKNMENVSKILGISEELAGEILKRQERGIPMDRIAEQLEREEL